MGATFSRVKIWIAEVLTAADLNAEFDNILNNLDPDGIDDASVNEAAMQAITDPYPGSAASLATDLTGELQRLRYVIKQILGTSYWYVFHDLTSKTTTYPATTDDRVIKCDATGGAFTVTLPTAASNTDKEFVIIKQDSSALAVTIDGAGAETINGLTTVTLDSQWSFAHIISDGTNWVILGGNSTIQKWKKGADTASATTLTFGDDGNYFDITGATGPITDFPTKGVGVVVKLHFDGAPTLEHNAAKLALPGGIDIPVVTGSDFEFTQVESGVWRMTASSSLDSLLTTGSITSDHILDGTIATVDMADESITDEKLARVWEINALAPYSGTTLDKNEFSFSSTIISSGSIANGSDTTDTYILCRADTVGDYSYYNGVNITESGHETIFKARIKTDTAIANLRLWAGLTSNEALTRASATPAVHGSAFRYDTGASDANWQSVTSAGGTEEITDTGVAVATSTRVDLEIRETATEHTFYINGTLVATNNTIVPTSTTGMKPYIGATSLSNTGTARGLSWSTARLIKEA